MTYTILILENTKARAIVDEIRVRDAAVKDLIVAHYTHSANDAYIVTVTESE